MLNDKFIFKSRQLDQENSTAKFIYQLDHGGESFEFIETLEFSKFNVADVSPQLIKNILESLHLVLGISYYKLFCPNELVLENIELSKEQAEFWNTIYTKGLGEFFYKNKLDFRGLINFNFVEAQSNPVKFTSKNRSLLGIGGGKDSIVAGEILKQMGKTVSAFTVNLHPIMQEAINVLGVETFSVKRQIDPLLLELNKRSDTYNGHVPVSAQNAFIGLLTATLFDYKYIVMANEQSANYGSVNYLDQEINHQWSKSYEFETLFQQYVKDFITPDIYYFSILRPFSEISIVEKFSKYPKYFHLFSSCNKNFRINNPADSKWCGNCSKCAFTFVMLSAFLSKKELTEIFGKNLFTDRELLTVYKQLLGVEGIKPLDCVGTPDEVKVAFFMASQKREYETDLIMKYFQEEVLPNIQNIKDLKKQVFIQSSKHNIPEEFRI